MKMNEFAEAWKTEAIKRYEKFVSDNFRIEIHQVTPNVYYKTYVNVKTYKRVKMKNFVYKDTCMYTILGERIESFDRSSKEGVRSEVNFILSKLRDTFITKPERVNRDFLNRSLK